MNDLHREALAEIRARSMGRVARGGQLTQTEMDVVALLEIMRTGEEVWAHEGNFGGNGPAFTVFREGPPFNDQWKPCMLIPHPDPQDTP